MCGLVGLVTNQSVNQDIYDALTMLQHRGQDAAGIATADGERLYIRKKNGLVKDIFQQRHMFKLRGSTGIGHVRYPTAGSARASEAQPFYTNSPFGICLVHNGNLTNYHALRNQLMRNESRHLNTTSDSELILNVFAHALQDVAHGTASADNMFSAVASVHKRCRGGYAAIALVVGHGVVGFRDPYGIRPLVIGVRQTAFGEEYMLASESVALDPLGFKRLRDVAPGEAVFIDNNHKLHTAQCAEQAELRPCIFEYVYLARPDSIIDNISVHKARLRMGEKLAQKIMRLWPDHDIDVVIPVPDTSRPAALQLSIDLGVKNREGLIKNRYVGRTFIMPGQAERKKSVRRKLNAISLEFSGRNVLLVDDSIVRGNTSKQIIDMARSAGAKKVYFASAAPPVRYPNVYGIDMPAADELIAHGRSEEEIREAIGADWLIYQDLNDLIDAVQHTNSAAVGFDTSCFSGDYITGDVTGDYLSSLADERSDAAKIARASLDAA